MVTDTKENTDRDCRRWIRRRLLCAGARESGFPPGRYGRSLLLDRNNYFVFSPLLIEAGIGECGTATRGRLNPFVSYAEDRISHMAEVERVDPAAQQVHYRLSGGTEPRVLDYDHLVIATGSVPRLPDVPGLLKYAHPLKSLVDAVALRDHIIQLLEWAEGVEDPEERKSLLHLVVVGANYTGVEAAGEFLAFMRRVARKFKNIQIEDCRATLFELSNRILPTLDDRLANYAAGEITRHGITIRLEETLAKIEADHCITQSGERIDAQTVIWCAGIAPPPLVAESQLPTGPRGYIDCATDFRVCGYENLWAIGDCSLNPDDAGHPYPPTAQHAVRMGAHLAANLTAVLRGNPTKPFTFTMLGSLAALGGHRGVARILGVDFSGWIAWFSLADGIPAQDARLGSPASRCGGLVAGFVLHPG